MITINLYTEFHILIFLLSIFFFLYKSKSIKTNKRALSLQKCDSVLWDEETVQDACTPRPSHVLIASTDYVCPIFDDSRRQIVRLLLINKLSHYKIDFRFFSPPCSINPILMSHSVIKALILIVSSTSGMHLTPFEIWILPACKLLLLSRHHKTWNFLV